MMRLVHPERFDRLPDAVLFDTDNTLYRQPEGPGLNAVAEGFRHLGFKDDHAVNAAEWIVYDALYAYCQKMVRDGRPHGAFT